MRNIIIFNQNSFNGAAYGIGAFMSIFKNIFSTTGYNIYLIEAYAAVEEFCIKKVENYHVLEFPVNAVSQDGSENEDCYINLLSLYINNIDNSILFFNYTSQYKIAAKFKKIYPHILTVGIIHSFTWVWDTNGDVELFKECISGLHQDHPTGKYIYQNYQEEKQLLNYFDRIISLSQDSYDTLHKIYNIHSKKLSVIPNGIPDIYNEKNETSKTLIKKELLIDENEKIILFVGRFEPLKGLDVLIAAFNRLLTQNKSCRLIITGDGNFSFISQFIHPASTKITFTGKIPHSELIKWYTIADIGVLPSLSEECSLVGIEMMRHQLPIISTNGRGLKNMFHHMYNSFTVNCTTDKSSFIKELNEAMVKLLNSEELRKKLGLQAREWYLTHYEYSIMKQRYLSLLEELIAL